MSETIAVEEGSGNICEDLGYPNAEEALIKARLAQRITEVPEKTAYTNPSDKASRHRPTEGVQTAARTTARVFHGTALPFFNCPRSIR